MYGVSHSAPNEYREMVRTDGTRRDFAPGNPGLDARPTFGHVATDEARALSLESSDKLTPKLRHDVLPRQSKHAEHFGEIDVSYAARKQALALDQQFHGDAFCIDHFAKLEAAVGGAVRILR
jgi:hypothetical protein